MSDYIYVAPTNQTQDGLRVFRYDQAEATLVRGEISAGVAASDALLLRGRWEVTG